jgi:phenylacetyl-CoA:acceptor oxidoreductase 26-kDa subunit
VSARVSLSRVELIPPQRQMLWGWPAVVNFVLGGLGAGWYAIALLAAGLERSPAVTVASWAAPALVLAGFAAVASEAGRPLRGLRVLTRVRTSWMSRELALGGTFVLLVVLDLALRLWWCRAVALVAALLLAVAQGFILRRARGVPAWDVPLMPTVFLLSALLSGGGVWLAMEALGGHPIGPWRLGALLALVVMGFAAWTRYLNWSSDRVFVRAVAPLQERRAAAAIEQFGYAVPLVLGLVALAVPGAAVPLLALAGLSLIAGQVNAKTRLILAVGQLRPITLDIELRDRSDAQRDGERR